MCEKTFFYPTNSVKCLNDDGSYDLIDPLDYGEYMDLISSGNASDRHHDEFGLRLINHFSASVYSGTEPDYRAMFALANIFSKISQGGRWDDELPMPWSVISLPFSPAEVKDIELFCQIANKFNEDKKQNITSIIEDVAKSNNVSFEKARAAYYSRRNLISDTRLID